MRKSALLITLITLTCFSSVAKQVRAYLSYATFCTPGSGPYIETYLSVDAHTIKLIAQSNGQYQGKVEVSISFAQYDSVKYADKYNLLSPLVKDSNKVDFQFIDQQRIALKNGKYVFKITIADKNTSNPPFTSIDTVFISYPEGNTRFSDIEPLEKYESTANTGALTKSGFNLTPFLGTYYPATVKNIRFYAELYNSATLLGNEPFLIKYYIIRLGNKEPYGIYIRQTKHNSDKVTPVLGDFDITDLPSGNYNLVIEAINRDNKIIATNTLAFSRNNPVNLAETKDISPDSVMSVIKIEGTFVEAYNNADTLAEYIRCLGPISGTMEQQYAQNQLKVSDIKLMQQYLYSFWHKRNKPDPQQAWLNYLAEVKVVNRNFATGYGKGYNTDRGRVYLQYGKPDVIAKEYNSTKAFPYEIWQYYTLKKQRNRKFVFYAKTTSTNNFVLIYSDANGEIRDEQWQYIILSGNRTSPVSDNTNLDYDRLNDLFQSPR